MFQFPSLENFEPTRATLHSYANAIGVIPRVHGIPHPKWWHISLKMVVDGLTTDLVPLPNGGSMALKLDFVNHQIVIQSSDGTQLTQNMKDGLTGTEMGAWVIGSVASLGLTGEYAHGKYESDEVPIYNAGEAGRFFEVLTAVHAIFKTHKANLNGEMSPIQLWPHGFDLAFDWIGNLEVEAKEHGELQTLPSQLNLGFYPGSDPYFYSNPFPFLSEKLLPHDLPDGARWHNDGWEGSILPYQSIIGNAHGGEHILDFAKAVYQVASPTLLK